MRIFGIIYFMEIESLDVMNVSLLWVACWSSDNAGGELAACSDEGNSLPGEARPLNVHRHRGHHSRSLKQRFANGI